MLLRLSVVFLCLVTVSACAIQPTDLSAVKEGATRAQVERVLSKPIKSVEAAEGRIDTYEYNRGYEPPAIRGGYGGGPYMGGEAVVALFLLPIVGPIAHSIHHEKQRGTIEITFDRDDRVKKVSLGGYGASLPEIEKMNETGKQKAQDEANQGDARAQWIYAIKYARGPAHVDWLCRSARQGFARSQATLGRMLHDPASYRDAPVTVNPIRAYMWYTLALDGNERAEVVRSARLSRFEDRGIFEDHRGDLRASMTPTQIAEGERLAAAWTPDSPCP